MKMMNDVINRINMSVDNTIEDFLVRSVREEAYKTKTDIIINARKILEAVQKQIPKNPILEADGYADGELVYDTWYCPNCDKSYEVDYDSYDFCPNCGQHILWEDEE